MLVVHVAKVSKVDSGSGRGRVALEHTIVVGKVYIQRMERTGMDRRDVQEGRPAGNLCVAEKGRTPTGAGAQPLHSPKPEVA